METKRNKGLGIAAIILGILGLIFSCFVIGIIFDILAVILGIVSLSDKTSAKGLPIAGISTGAIGIFIALIMLIAFAGDADKTDNESKRKPIESQKVLENETENEEKSGESERNEIEEAETKIENEETEESNENKNEFEYGDCTVKYLRHEIMENDIGETVLVVYYDFTNNGDDSQCFDYLVTGTAFQNGVEMESSFWHANEESKNSAKEIQKGITLTVAESYVLGESRENVTIELRPFNIWSDKLLMSLELTLE